jgi:hypothetical protein
VAGSVSLRAEQSSRARRIGVLVNEPWPAVEGLHVGLDELGYQEGKDAASSLRGKPRHVSPRRWMEVGAPPEAWRTSTRSCARNGSASAYHECAVAVALAAGHRADFEREPERADRLMTLVTSMTAPVASGWSGCRVNLAPTGKRRLFTAHARSRHMQCSKASAVIQSPRRRE